MISFFPIALAANQAGNGPWGDQRWGWLHQDSDQDGQRWADWAYTLKVELADDRETAEAAERVGWRS